MTLCEYQVPLAYKWTGKGKNNHGRVRLIEIIVSLAWLMELEYQNFGWKWAGRKAMKLWLTLS